MHCMKYLCFPFWELGAFSRITFMLWFFCKDVRPLLAVVLTAAPTSLTRSSRVQKKAWDGAAGQ